jgi:hypothetical protein
MPKDSDKPTTKKEIPPSHPTPGTSKNDESELVVTPGGWRPKSQVHRVEPGQHISGKGRRLKIIETATGKVIKDLGDLSTKKHSRAEPPAKNAGAMAPLPDYSWIANTGWTNNSGEPIAYFSTTWIVPPAPAANDNQLVYLFNGLEQSGSGASPLGPYILQPVLQWGFGYAGGGSYWTITNWYVDGQGGTALHKPLINVNPGDVLQGIMTLTGQSGTEFSYLSSFAGYPNADLTVADIDELTWACETLECYGPGNTSLVQCSDYPNTDLTAFYDIEIKVGNSVATSTDANITWDTETNFTDCGQNCLIVSSDSPGGAVYIYYQQVVQNFYFIIDKGTFGLDEVKDVVAKSGGLFSAAFWLAVEGFTVQQLTIDQPGIVWPTLSGAFEAVNGVRIAPSAAYAPVYDSSNLYTPQRILFPFDITFTSGSYGDFPGSGETSEALFSNITIGGTALPQTAAEFFLVAGADPYFTNIDPDQNNVYYLSQDLRVFTITPEANNTTPIGNVQFTFQTGSPTTLDTVAAYSYIRNVIGYFNGSSGYTDPGGTDPFKIASSVLPGQTGAYTGDSSVTPATQNPANPSEPFQNYNFALARVRLRGSSGTAGEAQNVRVFFRVFTTQTFDTNYINTNLGVSGGNPNITYPSLPTGSPNAPISPLPGTGASGNINGCTLPYFAAADQSDLASGGVNNQTIEIPTIPPGRDTVWAYFGCFLNVYDPTYLIGGYDSQHWLAPSTHNCIVAQIAYADAPIENTGGVIESPENSVMLAQRNLQITPSGNPGFPATHLIPQTFDTRPSPPLGSQYLTDYPDELMIDWRNTPQGSTAKIYWPQVNVADVLDLAAKLYPSSSLSASDSHTIACTVDAGMTFIPIPTGGGESFAGLITLQLPAAIRAGNEFDVVIRRVTSRRFEKQVGAQQVPDATTGHILNWRYIVGTFQMKIPVARDSAILPSEENLLAILKWRSQSLSPTDRWYPVLQRYLSYVISRVRGLGGNPDKIKPSQYGTANQTGVPLNVPHEHRLEFTGKVSGLRYDRFGDFEEFFLVTEQGHERSFRSHEHEIEELVREAWTDRFVISVFVHQDDLHRPVSIILRRSPRLR